MVVNSIWNRKEWQTSVVYWKHDSNLKKQSLLTNAIERKLCTQLAASLLHLLHQINECGELCFESSHSPGL